jgi:hypothetical protein
MILLGSTSIRAQKKKSVFYFLLDGVGEGANFDY